MEVTITVVVIAILLAPSIFRIIRARMRNKGEPFKSNDTFSQFTSHESQELLDAYKTLGLKVDATNDEIKTTYRKLALLYHPDRNHSDEAKEKMLKINAAYALIKKERDL